MRWVAALLFVQCLCTHAPSLQQSLQRFALPGAVLTAQPGTAAPRVDSARLALSQRASHAAPAARLLYRLGAVLRQRFAQHHRPVVARLASDHRADAFSQPGECCEQRGQAERTQSRHGAEGLNARTGVDAIRGEREGRGETVRQITSPGYNIILKLELSAYALEKYRRFGLCWCHVGLTRLGSKRLGLSICK